MEYWSIRKTSVFQHSIYSITPLLHYSIIPLLHYSITPLLHPILHVFVTKFMLNSQSLIYIFYVTLVPSFLLQAV